MSWTPEPGDRVVVLDGPHQGHAGRVVLHDGTTSRPWLVKLDGRMSGESFNLRDLSPIRS